MVRATITPWRTYNDLLQVRQQLYQLDQCSPSIQQYAVDRVMIWKQRGNLPHAIESTALLVDAILHHSNNSNSPFSIRAVYSAAFTRFVTGFCDIGRAKERGQQPLSMLDIARQIDMPTDFVALRHEATHEELPSLQRLMLASEQGLQWLWSVYWSRLEEPALGTGDEKGEPAEKLKLKAKVLMRAFRSQRRDAIRANSHQSMAQEQEIIQTSKACIDLYGDSMAKAEDFVGVLVSEGLLFPSKRELGSPLEGAFMIWDALLQLLAASQRWFVAVFIRGLLTAMAEEPDDQGDQLAVKEALTLWVFRVVDSASWTDVSALEKLQLRKQILRWACVHPGRWTQQLAAQVTATDRGHLRDEWQTLLEASRLQGELADSDHGTDFGARDSQSGAEEMGAVAVNEANAQDQDENALEMRFNKLSGEPVAEGWVRAATVSGVPIGVAVKS